LFVLLDFVAIGMVCLCCVIFYIIAWYGEQRVWLGEVKEHKLQKGK
jgi:hypothetical protein